jgi:hypothetical protein
LIHLRDQASVAVLDNGDSHFLGVLSAPDGLCLIWQLRTKLAEPRNEAVPGTFNSKS